MDNKTSNKNSGWGLPLLLCFMAFVSLVIMATIGGDYFKVALFAVGSVITLYLLVQDIKQVNMDTDEQSIVQEQEERNREVPLITNRGYKLLINTLLICMIVMMFVVADLHLVAIILLVVYSIALFFFL